MSRLLPPLLVLLLSTCVRAQLGLHPPSVDWQQIELPEGRIVFPAGYEARARRVATLIELLEAKHTRSVGEQHYPFDLILQTANTTINGYVGLAPFRSEFFLTPPQSRNLLSAGDWADLLTVHEYRHVQQNSNERRGLTKLASFLFGQQGWAGFSFVATPNWFSEGDAVIAETAFSAFGRGRTPAFSGPLRALLDNNTVYSYQKARNGSIKDLVPDHYRYGYAMLTKAREEYGNDVWKDVFQEGAKWRFIYPFSRALKRKIGHNTTSWYRETMTDLVAQQDSARAARGTLTEGRPIGKNHRSVVSYRFPQEDGQGRLLALRSGFQYRPALITIDPDGGEEKVLTYVGIQREPYVDVRGNLAVWMENRQHPRYTNLRYSDVILYEMNSGRKRQLTEGGKYLSPALSPDRKEIAVVRHDELAGAPVLVILDTQSGAVKEEYRISTSAVVYPRFFPNPNVICFIDQNYEGVAIRGLDRSTGKTFEILARSNQNIDQLRVTSDGQLTFSSGRDGVDNVYFYGPATNNQVKALTDVAIGAVMPRLLSGGRLVYAEPTPRGQRLRMLNVFRNDDEFNPVPVRPVAPSFFERPAAYAAEAVDLSAAVVAKEYPTSNVSDKLFGYKLHSWALAGNQVAPGFSIQGSNALNTVATDATVRYNTNTDELITSLSASYGGWFPVLTADASFTERQYTQILPGLDTSNQLQGVRQNLNQTSFGLTAAVPLEWVSGEFFTRLTPSFGLSQVLLKDRNGEALPANFLNGQFRVSAAALRRRASQQVASTLGVAVTAIYDRGFGGGELGSRFLLRSQLLLPGLHRTHGTRISLDFQSEDTQNAYQYPDFFQYSRGYAAPLADNVYRLGLDYQLPVLYPDVGAFGIYYLKRVRLNPFFDHGRYNLAQLRNAQTINSTGAQVFFDGTVLNSFDLSFGLQFAYLLSNHAFGGADSGTTDLRFLAVTTF